MTSLDTAETKTHRGSITVICSDGVRIRVDLNLFPSELLRKVARSEFADRNDVEILYDRVRFLKIYNKYLPQPDDYFQLPAQHAVVKSPRGYPGTLKICRFTLIDGKLKDFIALNNSCECLIGKIEIQGSRVSVFQIGTCVERSPIYIGPTVVTIKFKSLNTKLNDDFTSVLKLDHSADTSCDKLIQRIITLVGNDKACREWLYYQLF
jgi:hypothetical protein